jgi:hypothetical protein
MAKSSTQYHGRGSHEVVKYPKDESFPKLQAKS